MRLGNYCSNINMETMFVKIENSKTNEPDKFLLNLSQGLDLKSLNKHVALPNLSFCCKWGNIRQQYKNKSKKWI